MSVYIFLTIWMESMRQGGICISYQMTKSMENLKKLEEALRGDKALAEKL